MLCQLRSGVALYSIALYYFTFVLVDHLNLLLLYYCSSTTVALPGRPGPGTVLAVRNEYTRRQ